MSTDQWGSMSFPRSSFAAISLIVLAALVLDCGSSSTSKATSADGESREVITLQGQSGQTSRLKVEVAETEEQGEKGLSNRTSLPQDAGMLFVFEGKPHLGFWMKDTLLPLSVAFIGPCGEIVSLDDMQPNTLDIHNTALPYNFGLEVNAGWFAHHDIAAGNKVTLPERLLSPACR